MAADRELIRFDKSDKEQEIDVFPGSPNIQVMKSDGKVLHFDMSFEKDPFEKIDMLIAAPEIDINELR